MLLITGGLGFIGSHVAAAHLATDTAVVVTALPADRVPQDLSEHLGKRLTVAPVDIVDHAALLALCRTGRIDSIIHLAGPPMGATPPFEEYRQNTIGLYNVLDVARRLGMRRVTIASSIAVYFGLARGPFAEDALVRMGATHTIEAYKKAEELMGLYLAGQTGVDVVAMRLASIYGPRYRSRRHLPAQLVHAGVRGAGAGLEPGLPRYHAGDCATDLCYVTDCAEGIRLLHAGTTLRHRVYNIGSGRDLSNADYLAVARSLFPDLDYDVLPGRSSADWPSSVLDISRAREDFGYASRHDPAVAMHEYAAWLKAGNPF